MIQKIVDRSIILNDFPSSKDFSIYIRSSFDICFWFPEINLDMLFLLLPSLGTVEEVTSELCSYQGSCERFKATYVKLNATSPIGGRISDYNSGSRLMVNVFLRQLRNRCYNDYVRFSQCLIYGSIKLNNT